MEYHGGYARFQNNGSEGSVDVNTPNTAATTEEAPIATAPADDPIVFDKCVVKEDKNSFENPLFHLDLVTPQNNDSVQIVMEGKGHGVENPVAFVDEETKSKADTDIIIEESNLVIIDAEVENETIVDQDAKSETDPFGVCNLFANQKSLEDSIGDVRKEEDIIENAEEVSKDALEAIEEQKENNIENLESYVPLVDLSSDQQSVDDSDKENDKIEADIQTAANNGSEKAGVNNQGALNENSTNEATSTTDLEAIVGIDNSNDSKEKEATETNTNILVDFSVGEEPTNNITETKDDDEAVGNTENSTQSTEANDIQ